ncbi:hypothetical protein [Pelodictyon phaeoclathratiforme]|jgi:hypothetical protein|uniref:Uncharacterized protein n=1 Tax=Pelodictyon phaeoclathratiforme (strain DSM 5477 / BU-1) TaxID=324925 RepID=B4SBG2_PELPB|nr:hypothetical protein [Pelodictyon phaeoclathratiforme]ACF44016.1 conserved hypothetical protein [Pelodictyon phaeoclathratiforme BU-1]MBV5288304.1 hypothetical protein [Pelodictyon phaeoclathratiforme]
MVCRFPEKIFVINWLKALMLSPGMLFPAAYFLIYLSTNIYLNADFKKNLSQAVNQASGNTLQISIKSLKSGLVLDSITLNQIEFTPIIQTGKKRQITNHPITIKKLEIESPEVEKLLFSRKKRLSSTKMLCDKILAAEHLIQ